MPLARIISTSTKYSDGLADDLRSRGFQVLTSAPGDSVSESADLEITLNECLPDDASAAATDAAVTKDMRVFLSPQAFAGKIRSIEMFVLTPKRVAAQKLEEDPVEPSTNATPASVGKVLGFAASAEVLSSDVNDTLDTSSVAINRVDTIRNAATVEVEVPSAGRGESVQSAIGSAVEISPVLETPRSDSQSMIGRAVLASTQAAVPSWPNIAEMKLVPAELTPEPVKPVGVPLQVALPQEISAHGSAPSQSGDNRFWRVPMVAGIAAVLALSAIWLANRFSASHAQNGTTFQQVTPSSVEAATPVAAPPVSNPEPSATVQSSASVTPQEPVEKLSLTSAPGKVRAPHARTKRRKHHSDADYVAKDTTIYFSRQPTDPPGDQKPQARP